jgi:hypothetical protein
MVPHLISARLNMVVMGELDETRSRGSAWDIGADEYLACHGGT